MESPSQSVIPSWLRWPPNSCETCVGWEQKDTYTGICQKDNALDVGLVTDSRYRCPSFQRKSDDDRTDQSTTNFDRT